MFKTILLAGASASTLSLITAPADAAVVYNNNTPGLDSFTVASTGDYLISVYSASGGSHGSFSNYFASGGPQSGGDGVGYSGIFSLTAGNLINISIGAQGSTYDNYQGSSGYGSSVATPVGYLGVSGGSGAYKDGPGEAGYLISNSGANSTYLGTNIGNGSVEIESVPTGAVPEPESWVLMLAGFGVVGAAMRRPRALRVA